MTILCLTGALLAFASPDQALASPSLELADPTGSTSSRTSASQPARAPAADPHDPPATTLSPEAQLPRDAAQRLARRGLLSLPSKYNGQVHVRQRGRVRFMHLGRRLDIIQTRLELDRPSRLISPYQRCLLVGLALFDLPEPASRRVAMIGLGGGALTRFFHLKRPAWVFHSVELDPVVVAVARAFFGVVDRGGYRSYAMDGRRFIREATTPYDLIIMDAFDAGAVVPTALASQEFFRLLKSKLAPEGVLVMNFLVHNRRTYASLVKTLRTVFPKVARIPLRRFASRNVLLMAPADPARFPDQNRLRARALQVERAFGVRYRLSRCVDALNRDPLPISKGSVIRDSPRDSPRDSSQDSPQDSTQDSSRDRP